MGIGPLKRAVFLDRDGVLLRVGTDARRHPMPYRSTELRLEEGAHEACRVLHDGGFRLVVVTNQPDVARGTISRMEVDRIHAQLCAELPIDDVRVCPHDDGDRCECRKPRPGMLCDAARDAGLDLRASYLIGDRWRDIEAGRAAGCLTVLIDRGYDEPVSEPDHRAPSLVAAAEWIVSHAADEE